MKAENTTAASSGKIKDVLSLYINSNFKNNQKEK
jgi:hypothetical protein